MLYDRNNIAIAGATGGDRSSVVMENARSGSWIRQNMLYENHHPCSSSNALSIYHQHYNNQTQHRDRQLLVPNTSGGGAYTFNQNHQSQQNASQCSPTQSNTGAQSAATERPTGQYYNGADTPSYVSHTPIEFVSYEHNHKEQAALGTHITAPVHWIQTQQQQQSIALSQEQQLPVFYDPSLAGYFVSNGVSDVSKLDPNLDPRCFRRRLSANKKERRRTQSINNAFAQLRDRIPNVPIDTKLSKIKTLRLATKYIEYLMERLTRQEYFSECDDQRDITSGFKADLGKSRKRIATSMTPSSDGVSSTKKLKSRTGWPQEVWASELRPQNIDCKD